MIKSILLPLLCLPVLLFSQDCDCESNFEWVKNTFEKNDAGFDYTLSQKGVQAYEKHNELTTQKVKKITNTSECSTALYEWLRFFRSGHIAIKNLNQVPSPPKKKVLNNQDIIEKFKDSEKLDINLEAFTQYIDSKKEVDYEGIWFTDPYTIGIKKIEDSYIGFIIEADGVYWTKDQVKLKINPDNTSSYYMRDHSIRSFPTTELLGKNVIQTGFVTLERIAPALQDDADVEQYFKRILATKPYFESIDEQTAYLRIPTFRSTEKYTSIV